MENRWRSGPMLCALLLFTAFSPPTDGSPLEVMAAPHALRVGAPENIFVEIQDCTRGTNADVEITVLNYPARSKQLRGTVVALNGSNSCQAFGQILIPAEELKTNDNGKQYAYLQAVFPKTVLEKVVLLSFPSQDLFVQTDRNVYTPGSNVYFRIFSVMNNFKDKIKMNQLVVGIASPEGHFFPVLTSLRPGGILDGNHLLGEHASLGSWKIVAKWFNSPQLRFAAEFEVKDYVLPALSIKLSPESNFFYVDGTKLTVNIEAKYVFGSMVDGVAFVLFGIQQAAQKKPLPSSLQRVSITGGRGAATLRREHITQTFADIRHLMGSSIYATVSVLTETGADMAKVELKDIKILTSPYSISLDKTIKYFKPGFPFDLEFQVLNPDDTPAQHVRLVVEPGTMMVRSGANGIAKLPVNTDESANKLTITIKTRDPAVAPHRQAAATLEALPYTSTSKSYIHLVANSADVKLGDNLLFYFFLQRHKYTQIDITILILSRGRLVNHFRWRSKRQTLVSRTVRVTKEMIPSFCIIAYYHTRDNEVVSDALWVDVKDSCLGSLQLEKDYSYFVQRSFFQLKITGAPGATVGLVAVDKRLSAVHDRQGPTLKRIWDTVKGFNKYCTPGGGKDSMSVFYDAGLSFKSSAAETPHRQDLMCSSRTRRRRDVSGGTDDEAEESYMDDTEIVSRTRFSENWLWTDVALPPCPGNEPDCETTFIRENTPLIDSFTSWEIIGISHSPTHGICVADPLEITVRRNFLLDLKLPYPAVAGKQLEIKAVLHNLETFPIRVLVVFLDQSGVCSVAYDREKYQQEVQIEAQSSLSVPFVVLFTREGQHRIEVKAAVKDTAISDEVQKIIKVLPRGVLRKHQMELKLDPVRKGVAGRQVEILNSQLPLTDQLSQTPTQTDIFVTGHVPAPAESVIGGNTMADLIQPPAGSGETNMVQMTLPVIATVYLDKTNQWETVGFEKRAQALGHIQTGYQNQLAYRKQDGSFSVSLDQPSSTWLTAYVAKVFTMASSLVSVRSSNICDAIKFLIFKRQQPDGQFRETGSVNNRDMTGDVFGTDSAVSLTSFCLIALQESRQFCAYSISVLPQSILRAVSYLESRLPGLSNPYAVAMASYALANEAKLNKETLYSFASLGRDHWPVLPGSVHQLEATAYALLALVKAEALEEAGPVVSWLRQQPRVNGGYTSTQATMMVYQAVAEYSTKAKEIEREEHDLFVEVLLPDRLQSDRYQFSGEDYHFTRTMRSMNINQNIKVTATGKGRATLKVVSMYYAVPKETEHQCQKFNLSVQLIPESSDEDENVYKLKIDVLYLNKGRDSTMAVLDVGLLTGFIFNSNDLKLLSRARILSKATLDSAVFSNRGSLLINLDKVSHRQPEEITLRIHQILKRDRIQPAAVSVYEHDDPSACVKFYHPERKDGQLLLFCVTEECQCAEEDRCVQLKGDVFSNERLEKSCVVFREATTEFVYKVRLEEFNGDSSLDLYKMTILSVIKEARQDVGALGQLRIFVSQPHCRESLNLLIGKTYLVMGTVSNIHWNVQGRSIWYGIREGTWLEYWPTDSECQEEQHRSTCLGMEEMVQQQQAFGCSL